MPLPQADHKRLAAMLGVALSTAHEGEALAALRKAVALCAKHKLTLFDAIGSASASALDTKRIEQLEREAYARGLAAVERQALDAAEVVVKRRLEQEYHRGYVAGQEYARHNLAALPAGTGINEAQARTAQALWAAQQAQVNINAYGAGLGGLGNQAPNQGIYQPPPSQPPPPANDWRTAARALLDFHTNQLRPKDVDFLTSILARNRARLTEAQNNWLSDLTARFGIAYAPPLGGF